MDDVEKMVPSYPDFSHLFRKTTKKVDTSQLISLIVYQVNLLRRFVHLLDE